VNALGWKEVNLTYDPSNPASLDGALTLALQDHPVVVVATSINVDQISSSILSAYRQAGVAIDVAGAVPCATTQIIIGCVDSNQSLLPDGKILADWFVADSGGKGKAIFVSAPGYADAKGYLDGFTAEARRLCAACAVKIAPMSLDQIAAGQVARAVTAVVQQDRSYKYVFFTLDSFATGITSDLSAAGIRGEKIGFVDLDAQDAAYIRAGSYSASAAVSVDYLGYELADVAARYAVGAPADPADQGPSPYQLITRSNIGSINAWNYPPDQLQQFETLWQVTHG
jgi:ribose transport system substrate-binding protein